jgi:hypothetical protein
MDILPPAWADTTQQVDEILANITKMSARLDKLHARHVLPGFDDKSEEEGEIERLTSEITHVSPSMGLCWWIAIPWMSKTYQGSSTTG